MNKKTNTLQLPSGTVLKQGQRLRLADKITLMFPRLKGHILPVRDFDFLTDNTYDFRFVRLLVHADLNEDEKVPMIQTDMGRQAWSSKVLSLLEDDIVGFRLQKDSWYCHTRFFCIEIAQALATGEVSIAEESNTPLATTHKGAKELVDDIEDCYLNYALGLITDIELENKIADVIFRFFHWRRLWKTKDARWGFRGGTAASLFEF